MSKYTIKWLEETLELHQKFLNRERKGILADLSHQNLAGEDLSGVNLSRSILIQTTLNRANLSGANLSRANMTMAGLILANLNGSDLRRSDLHRADLSRADLRGADLRGADLQSADFSGAFLQGADLRGADLFNAKLYKSNLKGVIADSDSVIFRTHCPETGGYKAYKKAKGCLVELWIPSDALRSSATTNKCRASKAFVLRIQNINTGNSVKEAKSIYDSDFIYRTWETVCVENFDTNRFNECSTGIHHFLTVEEAMNY